MFLSVGPGLAVAIERGSKRPVRYKPTRRKPDWKRLQAGYFKVSRMVEAKPPEEHSPTVRVRPATGADYGAISTVLAQLHPDQPGAFHPNRVRQGHRSFVATDESGNIIGFALTAYIDYGLRHESAGTIEQLVVNGDARAGGIGRRLVDACLEWLQQEGVALVFVSTTDELGAAAFYERCGFARCTGPWLFRSIP